MPITEMFNSSGQSREMEPGRYGPFTAKYSFRTPKGKRFYIYIEPTTTISRENLEVSFIDSEGRIDTTGDVRGETIYILTAVGKAIQKYLKFWKKDVEFASIQFSGEHSRATLYEKLGKLLANKIGWKFRSEWTDYKIGEVVFYITNPKVYDEK